MIIGHLPAGYILSSLIFPRLRNNKVSRFSFIGAGLLGAVAPDLDLIYFYCFDHRAHPHHSYFSHFPVVWLSLLAVALFSLKGAERKQLPLSACIFALNGSLHMLLDFIASNIYWLAPWVNKPFSLFSVSRVYAPWWLNFLLHKSFAVEIGILAWAVYLWRQDSQRLKTG